MKTGHPCDNEGCSGTIEFDLGAHAPTGETQVVRTTCPVCAEPYELKTNINRL